MFGIQFLDGVLLLYFPLHELFGIIDQVNILDIKVIQVIQVVVKYDVKFLFYFFLWERIDVWIAPDEATHLSEEILLAWIQFRELQLYCIKFLA